MYLYSKLSHLTGLTRLHLPSGWERFVSAPYTDFRNIEDLKIRSVFLESGQLVFPSLTHLTRLEMRIDVEPANIFRGGALQMILPYASSLQSLIVRGLHSRVPERKWVPLKEFGKLSNVKFEGMFFYEFRGFCAALNCLSLTHLSFDDCEFSRDFIEKIAEVRSLTSLRSLSVESHTEDVDKMSATMPQLTSLRMHGLDDIEALTVLTALRVLDFFPRAQVLSNLSHVFSHMPNLESLVIVLRDRNWFSSTCFSHLKNLRSLSLEGYSLDEDIFPALAQLSGLTGLIFRKSYSHLQTGQWSAINALTNLERLELWDKEQPVDQMSLSALMEGKLSNLTYLSFYALNGDKENLWRTLHQILPSLRQCFIREPDSVYVYPEEFNL